MFRRITTVASTAFAVAAFAGLSGLSGVASAQTDCPDVHWIGAAGSGERTPAEVTQNDGMGRVVYQSLQDLSAEVQKDGRTLTAEAVEYPAVEAPGEDGGVGEWLGFIGSVDAGSAALGKQYEGFVQRCPASKVVLAGYSQGAMVVHRNLEALQASPNLAAVLLVADGDRLPEDPTLNLGTASGIPERGKGAAQDWPILAHAPGPLPPAIGARTISVCNLGDAVCDYNPDDEETPASYARGVAIHTSYGTTAGMDWTAPLYFLLGPAPEAAEAQPVVPQPVVPLSASAPTP
jgi:Cutinase